MKRLTRWIGLAGALLFLAVAAWQGALERSAPPHAEVVLDGGIPATFHLPGSETGRTAFLDAPPRGERPPAVVLMHGFASDRLVMSVLARRLARAGYAVLAFDASGHGQNRNRFERSFGRSDAFHAELATAVDFLRADSRVDGERIVVMGHSMGAGAVLDFATRDAGLDATVLISGGWTLHGPHRPPNALFIYAAGDPPSLKERSLELAARLAGVASIEHERTYGVPTRGTGVRVVEVPGTDHLSIVWTEAAALAIARWLDGVFGRPATAAVAADLRPLASLLGALSLLLVLPALGLVIGRLVPPKEEPPAGHPLAGLAAIALALLATMPLLAVDAPYSLLSIEVGDVVVSHLGLAGVVLLVGALLLGRPSLAPSLGDLRGAALPAATAILGIYVLLIPVGAVLHRMTLVPERAIVFVLAAVGLLPFALAYQGLLRRGSPSRAALVGVAGRVLVLGVLGLGVWLELLSFVVVLMLPALTVAFALFELLAASIYATSRNVSVVALIDAAWLGLIVAATMPVRL
jgi:dienelactone hydrolase